MRREDCHVFAENWPALQVFLRMGTQWRIAPDGRVQGLDYTALQTVMQLLGVEDTAQTFIFIQDFETGALAALGEN